MSSVEFPTNIVDVVAEEALAAVDVGADALFKRPLRPTDPDLSLGISAVDWVPESQVIGQYDPAVAVYLFRVEALVKHTNEEEGRALHSEFAKKVRTMLYRNANLRVRLPALREDSDGRTERVQRWGVRQQRYASNEITGTFLFLSTTDFWVETETV